MRSAFIGVSLVTDIGRDWESAIEKRIKYISVGSDWDDARERRIKYIDERLRFFLLNTPALRALPLEFLRDGVQ